MKPRKIYLLSCIVLAACWAGYILVGTWFAQRLAARIGGLVLRIGQGKFNDPSEFIRHRICEGLLLATTTLLWIAAHALLDQLIGTRRWATRWRWAAHGVAGFALLNVWIAVATSTALFWAVLGAGAGVQNYMQFQFKRVLAAEVSAPRRAVLMGSSQTRTQIDEGVLNELLGTKFWTTELHFPGSKAYDLLITEPQLERFDPQLVVCYFTEGYLYVGSHGEPPANFLTLALLPDAWKRNALRYLSGEEIGYGLLGDLVPLFRCRDVITQRILGPEIANLKQAQYDASLAVDLEARAKKSAELYRIDAESEFQKRALEDFIVRCAKAKRHVILLTGGYNRVLTRQINPAVREDMLRFLSELPSRHPNLTIIPASELPEQIPADYDDLNHVNRDMQRRFTTRLAALLEDQINSGAFWGR